MPEGAAETSESMRALDAHLAAMSATAASLEKMLGRWAQEWCSTTVEAAVGGDASRTSVLQAAGTYEQLMEEEARLRAQLPARIATGLRQTAWRHLFVNVGRESTLGTMAGLDYGTWQETGHKMPPAYEPVVERELGRVTQLLRKYGYRPEVAPVSGKHRYSAPPEAIPMMEAYYRLATRLTDLVTAAKKDEQRAPRETGATSWDL